MRKLPLCLVLACFGYFLGVMTCHAMTSGRGDATRTLTWGGTGSAFGFLMGFRAKLPAACFLTSIYMGALGLLFSGSLWARSMLVEFLISALLLPVSATVLVAIARADIFGRPFPRALARRCFGAMLILIASVIVFRLARIDTRIPTAVFGIDFFIQMLAMVLPPLLLRIQLRGDEEGPGVLGSAPLISNPGAPKAPWIDISHPDLPDPGSSHGDTPRAPLADSPDP